ncbi:TPA: ead/Ea22-like family protein [Vibrio cholerae]|nr:ead/Ea22-like family protein [Vibrio cholerae]
MNIEIPDFLIEMSKQMHEQNNRITADPIWQVRHKQYLVTEQGYNESHWEIAATEEGCTLYHSQNDSDYQELILYLIDNHPDWMREWAEEYADMEIELDDGEMMLEELELDRLTDAFNSSFDHDWHDLPEGVKKFHMQEIEVVVKTCLTEEDANAFIQRKQHDYPKLYTYVESMVGCQQMIELRNWILSLTEKPNG